MSTIPGTERRKQLARRPEEHPAHNVSSWIALPCQTLYLCSLTFRRHPMRVKIQGQGKSLRTIKKNRHSLGDCKVLQLRYSRRMKSATASCVIAVSGVPGQERGIFSVNPASNKITRTRLDESCDRISSACCAVCIPG